MRQRSFTEKSLSSSRRKKENRKQRKHEFICNLAAGTALLIVWLVVIGYALGVWAEHPAEQPVSGVEYLASIQDGDF